jgi:hypothetical protein
MTDVYCTSGNSPTRRTEEPDFICEYHISLFLLRPLSPAASDWIAENLPSDRLTWNRGTVIEPRYIFSIILAIQDEGLTVVPR